MRSFFGLVLSTCLLTAARGESDFPTWQAGELSELQAAGWVAGSVLLTGDPVPEEFGKAPPDTLVIEQPKPEEVAEDLVVSPEIPEKFLRDYFDERPKSFLIDPQGIMSPSDYRDRLGFLNYHASDSSIDLFVYVVGGDQEIPSAVREEETIERFFSEGRPAAIVFYFWGAPQRSAVYLSPSITDSISTAEQRRTIESSVMHAFEKTNPAEQIERFLVQLSIRVYWMDRMLDGEAGVNNAIPSHASDLSTNRKSERKSDDSEWLSRLIRKWALPVGILVGSVIAGIILNAWLRLRTRYYFPEFEVEARLGGAHAAGIGAVISFASAAVPPASQRDQVPDYLKRA